MRNTFSNNQFEDRDALSEINLPAEMPLSPDSIEIIVRTPTGEDLNLKVEPSETIQNIKATIEIEEGTASYHQRLVFNDGELENERRLSDYNIQEGGILLLERRILERFKISIKIPNLKNHLEVKVGSFDTIESVKAIIQDNTNIPLNQQTLVFSYKELENERILCDCNIKNDSKLELLLNKTIATSVKTPTGKTISIELKLSDTIENLKEKISKRINISPREQCITLCGKELDNEQTLSFYNYTKGNILYLTFHIRDVVKIFVKTPTGKKIDLEVKLSNLIENVKENILNKISLFSNQRLAFLTFSGHKLENGHTLSDYDIQQESTIILHEIFEIFVQTPAGEKINLEVDSFDTIVNIKAKIQNKEGIFPNKQILMLDDEQLENEKTLSDYSIQKESLLYLRELINIFVQTTAGETITFEVEICDTIENVKVRIEIEEGISLYYQRLLFNDKVLENNQTISHYNIQKGDTIVLSELINIFINTPAGEIISLEVESTDTIKNVKTKIHKSTGNRPNEQYIEFAGKKTKR